MGVINIFGHKFRWERYRSGDTWLSIGGGNENWDLGDKLETLLNNPVTFRCADLIGQLTSQAEFTIDGEEQPDNEYIKLLNNPNPLQSKQDFMREFIFLKYAYGWVFQKPMKGVGAKVPKYIYNLNPSKVEYNKEFKTRLIFTTAELKDLEAKQFRYQEEFNSNNFNIEDVIPFFDVANGLTDDFLLRSPSRLEGIRKNIRNIDVALDSENRAIQKAGRFVLSAAKNGNMIAKSMDVKDKNRIEKSFGGYGNMNLNGDVIITDSMIESHSLHIPLAQLGLAESIGNNAAIIRNHFGVPRELYNLSDTGGKYDSVEQAPIQLIQNVVQNQIDDFCNSYSSYFGIKLEGNLNHLSVMQYVEDKKAEKLFKISQAIKNLSDAGVDYMQLADDLGIELSNNGK